MLIDKNDATLLVVDVQEKLLPAVSDAEGMLARCCWLVAAAHDLGLPVWFSEQYSKGLGHTEAALLAAAPEAPVLEKIYFSCVAGDGLPAAIMQRGQVIVCGMEAHVCVLQTVLELLALGKTVFVVADAVASRSEIDRELGLQRMQAAGAVLVTREMVLFESLRMAGSELFRQISNRYLRGSQP